MSHDMGTDGLATITLSMPQELKDELEQRAKAQDRSVSSLVRVVLRDTLGLKSNEEEDAR